MTTLYSECRWYAQLVRHLLGTSPAHAGLRSQQATSIMLALLLTGLGVVLLVVDHVATHMGRPI